MSEGRALPTTQLSPDRYWASIEGEAVLPFLCEKIDRFHDFLSTSGLRELWHRAHKLYQLGAIENTIDSVGEQAEFERIFINHVRSIARHVYVGTTSARPSFQPRAVNTDYRSRVQVRLADATLQYYVVEKRGEQRQNQATERSLLTGEGYLVCLWDPNAGRIVDIEELPSGEAAQAGGAPALTGVAQPPLAALDGPLGMTEPAGQSPMPTPPLADAVAQAEIDLEPLPETWDELAAQEQAVQPMALEGQPQFMPPAPAEPDTGEPEVLERPIYEGDIAVHALHAIDVIRDVTRTRYEGSQWLILRFRRNRFDLAALYPEQRDEILAAPTEEMQSWDQRSIRLLAGTANDWDSDELPVFLFLHDRTPAMPHGRAIWFLAPDVMLRQSDLDAEQMDDLHSTVLRIAGDEIEGIPFGYTWLWDLFAIQDAVNTAHSTALTNLANFGVTNLTGPAGAVPGLAKIGKGLNYVTAEGGQQGEVKTLELLEVPQALIALVEMWEKAMETLSGVNSVTRGNPEASLKSGAALALVQSQFLEFTRDFQAAYAHLWEDFGTSLVHIFQTKVPEPRLAAIVGTGDRAYVKELAGDDLDQIDRVVVEMGSYLARTAAGRINLAEQLQAAGYVTTPEQYIGVIETGRLEPVTHHQMAELDLVQLENEKLIAAGSSKPPLLADGQLDLPLVLMTDNHVLHIKEHHGLTCDPEVRANPAAVSAILSHIQSHINELMMMDPVLAAVLAQPALNGMFPTQTPTPGGRAPQRGEGPPNPNSVALPATNPVTGQQGEVTPAQPPTPGA